MNVQVEATLITFHCCWNRDSHLRSPACGHLTEGGDQKARIGSPDSSSGADRKTVCLLECANDHVQVHGLEKRIIDQLLRLSLNLTLRAVMAQRMTGSVRQLVGRL